MINNISFVTAHFFDFEWTEMLVNNIINFTDPKKIKEILIINQDRSLESHNRLVDINPKVKVVEFPKSVNHFQVQGHDHAAVLNCAMKKVNGEYVCIFDSDAHPINNSWLLTCEEIFKYYDAILALVPGSAIRTHPCFMMMKNSCINAPISFDEGLFTDNEDTGRLVGKQLLNHGYKIYFAQPNRAFNGLWGSFYLNVIYHHKSASFSGADDERITRQVIWKNKFFKQYVINKHRYELNSFEYFKYKVKKILMKKRNIISIKTDDKKNLS